MLLIDRLTAIGNAIRSKTGGQAPLTLSTMATQINATLQNKSVSESLIKRNVASIDSDVGYIGSFAFVNCTSLTSATLTSATTIGTSAFENCAALTSVSLASAQSLASNVFRGCTSLTRLDFNNLTSISAGAFSGCTSLATVVLGQRAELADVSAFANCPAIIYVNQDDYTWYANATNWSTLFSANRIKLVSQLGG